MRNQVQIEIVIIHEIKNLVNLKHSLNLSVTGSTAPDLCTSLINLEATLEISWIRPWN